jgi:hypothetical protein
MTTWANRIIGVGEEAPDQLLANPLNARVHPKSQQDALSTVLEKVGIVQQVVVNQRSGFVVDGHLRIGLALRTGQKTIPVLYVDLSDDEERIVLASLDSISAMAGIDDEKYADLLQSIESEDAAIAELVKQLAKEERVPLEDVEETPPPSDMVTCPECGAQFNL